MIDINVLSLLKSNLDSCAEYFMDSNEVTYILNKSNIGMIDNFMNKHKKDVSFFVDNDNDNLSFVSKNLGDPLDNILFYIEKDIKNKRLLVTLNY